MSIRYSDQPDVRPCVSCGDDTAPGSPYHAGSQQDFIEIPCEEHDRGGVIGVNCPDCSVQIVYLCNECANGPDAAADRVQSMEIIALDESKENKKQLH